MRLKNLNIKKINLNEVDEKYSAQDILMKLGELYQFESGIYGYGNLWTKLERIVEDIIIDELDKSGCIHVEFPKLQPRKIWDMSDRWDLYTKDNDIMFVVDNNLGEYGLAPTAEECATIFGANRLPSYKNLPATYYQISEKFRKEIRTRGYLFRPRTFVMMDAYSFDKTEEDLNATYEKMDKVYKRIFDRLGIKIIPVVTDSGAIGGNESHEYQVISKLGEDTILYSEEHNIGINKEVLEFDNKEEYLKNLGNIKLEDLKECPSVELGNNFKLGTKYSEAMKLYYKDSDGVDKPYYMGCYGIGLGRIIATILENNLIYDNDKLKGFSLPYKIAPYKVQIVYKEELEDYAKDLYNKLNENNLKPIIDDRSSYSLGNKIKDAYVLGTPYIIILGSKFDNENIEIEETKTGEKFTVKVDEIINFFKKKN